MPVPPRALAAIPAVVAAALCLSNCGFGGGSSSPQAPYIIVTQPRSLAAGQSVTLTATASDNRTFSPYWQIYGPALNSVGTLSGQSGNSIVYTAPAAPPIYAFALPTIPQGQVQVQVLDSASSLTASDSQFVILAAAVSVTISPTVATVPRGTTYTFSAYAVGAVSGAVTWQVNGIAGGNSTVGTVDTNGLYRAPALIPLGGTVSLAAVSVADPTKSATAIITVF